MRRKPAVILDRDGVLNYDSHDWVKRFEEVRFMPGALDAMRRLHQAHRTVFLATNQSWVSKRIIPDAEAVLADTLSRICGAVSSAGGHITRVFFCPHQDSDRCACRKPQPGLLLQIAQAHNVDLSASVMCGDSWRDVEAAAAAGVGTVIFLRTRPTVEDVEAELALCRPPDHQVSDLAEAVDLILRDGLGADPA